MTLVLRSLWLDFVPIAYLSAHVHVYHTGSVYLDDCPGRHNILRADEVGSLVP